TAQQQVFTRGLDGGAGRVGQGLVAVGRGRVVEQVDAIELGVRDDRGDLVADGLEVFVQGRASRGRQTGVGGREGLFLQLAEQVGDRLAGREGDVQGRLAAVQAVLDRVQGADFSALSLGDGEDGAVVLVGRDDLAGVDAI